MVVGTEIPHKSRREPYGHTISPSFSRLSQFPPAARHHLAGQLGDGRVPHQGAVPVLCAQSLLQNFRRSLPGGTATLRHPMGRDL